MRRALGCAMLVLWSGVVSGNQSSEALKARQAEARRQQAEVQERISALQKKSTGKRSLEPMRQLRCVNPRRPSPT
ncbi:hypothetical protein [Neopusillimonas aromaticivorans]|uniref:hypothetical protein n=1 Tax=Neopusillimonas aromaticivorans TaxID=2979868 RepID=UPI002598C5FF|nr:hypothetical protein [Neopusillimonas aromaticivorans]WJJ92756.1 hypothetical protein N7E01_10780 [Neopusillimonas aromaticivorans]